MIENEEFPEPFALREDGRSKAFWADEVACWQAWRAAPTMVKLLCLGSSGWPNTEKRVRSRAATMTKRPITRKRGGPMPGPGPVINDIGITDEEVALAVEASERVRASARQTWADYKIMGGPLLTLKRWALKKANKHEPRGKGYRQAFNRGLKLTGMDKLR